MASSLTERADSEAINHLVGRSTLLGDKGYRGGESSVPFLFVVEDDTRRELRIQRTLVECFFGRLKNKYKTFGRKWVLGVDVFDGFFDCACALTNADILVNPLSADDRQQNETSSIHCKRTRLRDGSRDELGTTRTGGVSRPSAVRWLRSSVLMSRKPGVHFSIQSMIIDLRIIFLAVQIEWHVIEKDEFASFKPKTIER